MVSVIYVFLTFAVLHSLTASPAFKKWFSGIAGERWMRAWYRLLFTMFSAFITAAAAWLIAVQPDTPLWRPPLSIEMPMRAVQALGLGLMLAAFRPFDAGFFSGIRQAILYLKTGRTSGDIEGIEGGVLVTAGAYSLVRHPMYLGGIMIFLFEPYVTGNTLVLRSLAALYFVYGAVMEDRRLAADFGREYILYREKVPMFNIISGWLKRRADRVK